MKVVITNEAQCDLETIGDYIARHNPDRARSFVRELIEKAMSLADMPRRFPLVSRYEQLGIRSVVHGNHLVFYRVESDRMIVIHVLHGARDYQALLFPDQD